ncbi:multidrug effflux MFS transporter [Rothia nasimurium]|uniref:multidrug effflux MFS transporter n=1 Tax=Rothia nasimurium TaxID=85336 RepID=UPI001F17A780|nr:multidrug effflux MFS transporter [Rothia nasimurium]
MSTPHQQEPAEGPGLPLVTIFTLASLTAVGPLAIDMYLAALPTIASDLATTAPTVQLTLTAFLAGMGAGQFVVGPLSDKTGRRLPLLVGVVLCAAATLACAFAPTIEILIASRFLMGFTGAIGLVLSRAVIVDSTSGLQTAKLMSVMMMINGFAPVVAPLLGGVVLTYGTWRDVFKVIAVLVACSMVLVALFVKESLPPERRRTGSLLTVYTGMVEVAKNRRYRGFMLTLVLAFGALFAYVSGSPYLLQNVMGLSEVHFTYAFGFNSMGVVLASFINAFLIGRVAQRTILTVGASSILLVSVLLTLHFLMGPSLLVTMILLFTFTTSVGLIFGNASALAMGEARHIAGSASALMGTTQSLVGGLSAPLVALGGSSAYLPMALTMLGFSLLAGLSLFTTPRSPSDYVTDRPS